MLRLYEELALLALDEGRGVYKGDYAAIGLAGGLFAELLLENRIAVEPSKKKLIDLRDAAPLGDPLLDECLQKIVAAKRRASATTWVSRFANLARLKHRVAERLCQRGILRAERATVFLMFTRQVYPEIDPQPEQELRARLERAIFTDAADLDARTIVLVSLADSAGFLKHVFGKQLLKTRAERLKQIRSGAVAAEATKEAIDAMNAAVMVAVLMPMMASAAASSSS